MRRARNDEEYSLLTFGQALAGHARIIIWCKGCEHKIGPDVAEPVERHGASMMAIDWAARLQCSKCSAAAP
jgi:hypothetical protein